MPQQYRPGRYSIEAQRLLLELGADSVAVSVVNGRQGNGCSVETLAVLDQDPELLRKHGQVLLFLAQAMIAKADMAAGTLRLS